MRVIGIDPGYDRLGVAVLEKQNGKDVLLFSTCIETDRSEPLSSRLQSLGAAFEETLTSYTPHAVALETLFFNSNQKTAMAVAAARGVILFLAASRGCATYELSPQAVKVAVTGYGKSDKDAVRRMLPLLVRDVPSRALDDEYDAIGVGITCLAQHA